MPAPLKTRNQVVVKNLPVPATAQGTVLVDASNLEKPEKIPDVAGFYFFGTTAASTEPEMSKEWLTEIVAAKNFDNADKVLGEAVRHFSKKELPALSLSLQFNCTRCGKNTRIVRQGLAALDETWSYVIVDDEDLPNQTVAAKEIWLSRGSKLTPSQVDGKPLLSDPQKKIDGKEIARKIAADHP